MKLRYNDEIHAYWLDGKRCKGVTGVAKVPDNTFYLDLWQKRQVAIGLASEPRLLEQVAAHVAEREQLDAICEKAMQAAKAHHAAEAGTTAHRFTEAHDSGQTYIETELGLALVKTWTEALEAGGFEVVDNMVERIAIHPGHRIAGTFDRILRRKRDGRLFIADLKTGDKALDYPHAIAVQLALYANATLLAEQLDHKGETMTFEPMPDVDKETGIVIHMPTPDAAELVEFDIAAGWECFQDVILPTYRWRDRKDLCKPLEAKRPRNPVKSTDLEPDEGPDVKPEDVAKVRFKYQALEPHERLLVNSWSRAIRDVGGRSLNLTQRPSRWRYVMVQTLCRMAVEGVTDEDVRTILHGATHNDDFLMPGIPFGKGLASLTVEEVERLQSLVFQLPEVVLTFGEDGKPVFSGPAYDAIWAA